MAGKAETSWVKKEQYDLSPKSVKTLGIFLSNIQKIVDLLTDIC